MIKFITFIFLFLFPLKALSDQNSPNLDRLFDQLRKVDDMMLQNQIVGEIWSEWMKTNNSQIEKVMNIMPYFFETQNYEEAIEALNYVIELDPNFAEGYNKRATFYFLIGEYEKSINDIDITLSLEPRHFGAMDGLARILISYGNFSKAIEVYNEMKILMPNDVSIDLKIDRLKNQIYDNA